MTLRKMSFPLEPIAGLVVACLLALLLGCSNAGGGGTPPPPPPPMGFTISSVSPSTVDESETLTITYSGTDPGQQGNPVVATFQQGTLLTRQGKFLGSDTLGNNSFRVFFQVPNGLASDSGIIPVPSTVSLSNSQSKSTPQNILIAPPPSLTVFPEELYLRDTDVALWIHGNVAHFDASTIVSGSSGLKFHDTTVVDGTNLLVTLDVTATSAGTETITVASGGSDPKSAETISASLIIAAVPSPLFGASSLSASDAPPGGIFQVRGLFIPQDSVSHNTVTWLIGGHSIQLAPLDETTAALDLMVPLWANPDGSAYTGPASLVVRASGRAAQFSFTIDPLPANSHARGVVFNALLDAYVSSLPTLQNSLASVTSSSVDANAFQVVKNDSFALVSQLRQFVNSEAAGMSATPPGATSPVTPQQFDILEQLLVNSGAYQQAVSSALASRELGPTGADLSLPESVLAGATIACRAPAKISKIVTYVEGATLSLAVLSALSTEVNPTGPLVAAGLLSVTTALDELSNILSFAEAICDAFPVALTKVTFDPAEFSFTSPISGAQVVKTVTGDFTACDNPTALLAPLLEHALEQKFKFLYKILPDKDILNNVIRKLTKWLTEALLSAAVDQLKGDIEKYLGVSIDLQVSITTSLTSATIRFFSANLTVAAPFPNTDNTGVINVRPTGTGATQIRADLGTYNLLLGATTTCMATESSLDVPGNAAQVTVQGPPIVIPTNSGGSTGIIPGTLNGNPIDKAYVAVPDANVVSVLNADGQAGSPPITTIPMPSGFLPTATAANPKSSEVYVISSSSPDFVRIDAKADQVTGVVALPVVDFAAFSGGNCMVCGVVADPIADQVIFDTADGYFIFDITAGRIVQSFKVLAAENFGYNPLTRQIVNPFYNAPFFPTVFGLDLLDLGSNVPSSYSGSVGLKPDAAAVDYTTNIAIVANEAESTPVGFVTFINLAAQQTTSSSFSAPTSTFQFPDATGFCSGGGNQSEWTMLSVDPANHFLFTANEFSDCAGILDLPPIPSTGAPSAASQFRFGEMPVCPDGQFWANSLDPHGNAVFVSVIDGRSYGFLLRKDGHFVARIDLKNLFNAPVLSGTPGAVGMAPLVTYLSALPK